MLLERPSFISRFLKCDNEIKLQSGEKICVYTIKAVSNKEKNEWAKHLLNNFTTEQEIINGAKLNNVSKAEYIKQFVLPSEDLRNGSELSGVFGENYEEAQWNYCKYFTVKMKDEIKMIENPLGLKWWDELD